MSRKDVSAPQPASTQFLPNLSRPQVCRLERVGRFCCSCVHDTCFGWTNLIDWMIVLHGNGVLRRARSCQGLDKGNFACLVYRICDETLLTRQYFQILDTCAVESLPQCRADEARPIVPGGACVTPVICSLVTGTSHQYSVLRIQNAFNCTYSTLLAPGSVKIILLRYVVRCNIAKVSTISALCFCSTCRRKTPFGCWWQACSVHVRR